MGRLDTSAHTWQFWTRLTPTEIVLAAAVVLAICIVLLLWWDGQRQHKLWIRRREELKNPPAESVWKNPDGLSEEDAQELQRDVEREGISRILHDDCDCPIRHGHH